MRWNSIFAQIERFLIIEESVAQVLHEYQHHDLQIKRDELEYLETVKHVLKIVKQASERLCNRNVTLFDADNCLKWMFLNIKRYPNGFSNKISEALYTRITF